jgi:hypothetical protein
MEIIENVSMQEHGLGERVFALGYSLFSYAIGAGALFWLIFAAGGLAPLGFAEISNGNGFIGLAVNVVLVLLFGVQHSVMARSGFKRKLVRYIPAHLNGQRSCWYPVY